MPSSTIATKLFFSYSHADEGLRDQLEVHLAALHRQGLIDTWHDRRITPGENFADTISEEIEEAKIILLLVSPDFIASDYCYEIETRRALERHEAKEARVIPIVLRPCDWHDLLFGQLLALPKDGKPITQWPNSDEAFLDVVQGIKKALNDLGLKASEEAGQPSPVTTEIKDAATAPPEPRSSNLRLAKTFTDRDKDDFLHEAFAYIAHFFQNSLEELEKRNPGIEGRFRRSGEDHFSASIYRNGTKAASCSIYLAHDYGGGEIRFAHGEQQNRNSYNESLSVDHDEQSLFLKPMGLIRLGDPQDEKLTKQGSAALFWRALIEPLQRQ